MPLARPAPREKAARDRKPAGRRALAALACLVLAFGLSACDTAEERAERHYERALALVAEGEIERAGVEFRNVFRLNGGHVRARLDYARLMRDRGDTREAIAHYLRLVEQDRHHAEGHRELVALALEIQDVALAEEYADRAHALDPDHPLGRALKAAMDLRRGEVEAAREAALAVREEDPSILHAHLVLIAERMRANDAATALAHADRALAALPGEQAVHVARLGVLEMMEDMAAIGAALERMTALFPEDRASRRALVAWHLRMDDPEAAEAVLRDLAGREEGNDGHFAVVQFLYEIRGRAAAQAELDRLAAAADDPAPFLKAKAELDFAEGEREAAIAALESLAAAAPEGDSGRDLKATLGAMLYETGRREEAAALAEAVLAEDRGHVGALKLRARHHLDSDRSEAAIADLRAALAQSPDDPALLTLMAAAHEREGARELAGERLARAVEASGHGRAEALRYARHLMEAGRPGPAEDVVLRALRLAPEDPALLAALGEIHLARGDLARARRVVSLLAGLDDPVAAEAAAALRLATLRREGRREEEIALLEEKAADRAQARLEIARMHAAEGDLEAAAREIAALRAAEPDHLPALLAEADLLVLRGETDRAEAAYRDLAAERADRAEPHAALARFLLARGRADEAEAAIETGIAATGRAGDLLFAHAGLLEARGDFEGAIALYEELYARDPGQLLVANNLASLLAAHRDDAESLERAHRVARRLQGSDVPHFQDTWGWILHRRGDPAAALAYLEPAARALAEDPLVQYHLGMAYLALGRHGEAEAALGRAVTLAGEESPLPQIAAARARLAELAERQEAERRAEGGNG